MKKLVAMIMVLVLALSVSAMAGVVSLLTSVAGLPEVNDKG